VIRREGWMKLHERRQQGLSISEISRTLHLDRKTVRKQWTEPLRRYQRQRPRTMKREAYAAYLRQRWEQGVHHANKLFTEIQKRGYAGGYTQIKELLRPWREEERQRAYVRFETGPGEQSQMDWGHFGNGQGQRLYAFAVTLGYSRMRYVEFTQRQDTETLLSCLVHAFHYVGGVTESILTDNMKTVVEDRVEGPGNLEPALSRFCRLRWLCAARVPTLPAANEGHAGIEHRFSQKELLAGGRVHLTG
jgi:transposase